MHRCLPAPSGSQLAGPRELRRRRGPSGSGGVGRGAGRCSSLLAGPASPRDSAPLRAPPSSSPRRGRAGRKVAARRGAHPAAQTPSGSGEGLGLGLALAHRGGAEGCSWRRPAGRAEVLVQRPGRRAHLGRARRRRPCSPAAGAGRPPRPACPPRASPSSLGKARERRPPLSGPGAAEDRGARPRGGEKRGSASAGPAVIAGCSANLRALTRGAAPRRSDICPPGRGAPRARPCGRSAPGTPAAPAGDAPRAPRARPQLSPRGRAPSAPPVPAPGPQRERRALPEEPPLLRPAGPRSRGEDCAAPSPPPRRAAAPWSAWAAASGP